MTAVERLAMSRASDRHVAEIANGTDPAEAFHLAAAQYLDDIRNSDDIKSVVADLVATIAANHGTTVAALRGPQRHADIVDARRDAAFALRGLGLSTPKIGAALGGRHHATILNLLGRLRPRPTEEQRHAAKLYRTEHPQKRDAA